MLDYYVYVFFGELEQIRWDVFNVSFLNYYKMRYSLVLVIFFVLNHIFFLEKKNKQNVFDFYVNLVLEQSG